MPEFCGYGGGRFEESKRMTHCLVQARVVPLLRIIAKCLLTKFPILFLQLACNRYPDVGVSEQGRCLNALQSARQLDLQRRPAAACCILKTPCALGSRVGSACASSAGHDGDPQLEPTTIRLGSMPARSNATLLSFWILSPQLCRCTSCAPSSNACKHILSEHILRRVVQKKMRRICDDPCDAHMCYGMPLRPCCMQLTSLANFVRLFKSHLTLSRSRITGFVVMPLHDALL